MKGNFINIITKKIKKKENKNIYFSMSLFVFNFSNYQDPGCEGTYDVVFDEITDQEDIDYFKKQIEKSLRKE